MFKYTNAFTNRSGDSLPGYFAKLYDSDGNHVDLFADAAGTPISTVSGVANAALSDENGMFRWYVANGTYDIRFYDSNDTFVSVEVGVPMIDASGVYDDLADVSVGKGASLIVMEGGGTVEAAILARPTIAALALSTAAALVGSTSGNVQTDIDARPTTADLAAPTGGEMVGVEGGGTVESTRKPVVWARPTGGDDTASLNAALAALDTSGGKAAVLDLSAGFATISGPLTIPTRCTIRGNGTRNSGLNLSGATARIVADSVDRAGIRDLRIAGASNVTRLMEFLTTTADVSAFTMDNVEFAGTGTNGQEGIYLSATGGRIITECNFNNILLKSLDRPLRDLDTEGNFWTALTIDQFAFTQARSAIEAQGLANQYQARVAGMPFTGSVGMTQTGAGCLIDLAVDIGASATALNVTGLRNNIRLSRPEALTPRGTVAKGNILLDEGEAVTSRVNARGIGVPDSSNFALTDWGNAATVTAITGCDQGVVFTVNSAGTGQAANPTIDYTFEDGTWTNPPTVLLVQRAGGNQLTVDAKFSVAITSTGWTFRWGATPADGEFYTFQVALI